MGHFASQTLHSRRYDEHLVSNPADAGSLFEYWAQPGMARWAIGMLSEVRAEHRHRHNLPHG